MSEKKRAKEQGWTDYSEEVAGDLGNHQFAARFDVNADGYVGISQKSGDRWADRVLLTPKQVTALRVFLRGKRTWD